jgi:choline dehydrogenase-like flavoprotein
MKLAGASASALLVVAAASAVSGASTQRRAPSFSSQDSPLAGMLRRSVTGNGNTLSGQTFDYVVVGGGLAGLVVANRLSADSNFTVAVIEAGADAYGAGQERILVPAGNLYNSALRSAQDWNWQTEGQAEMGGRQLAWPRGKVLGGSSAVNGLYMVRASAAEHNSWGALAGDSDRWGWDNVYRAMKKSEHFVPPSASVQEVLPDLSYNAASHGQDGSIYTSWPGVAYSSTNDFLQSMAATVSSGGVPICRRD